MAGTVKRQQDTPDSEQPPAKRQKVNRCSLDAGRSLALEHLLHDDTSHPLYHRNAEHIVNTVVDRDALTELITLPFSRCLRQPLFDNPNLDSRKVELAKQTLVNSLSKIVLAALGTQIASVYDVNAMRGKLDVVEDAKGYRVELAVVPVLEFPEEVVEAGSSRGGGVSTRDDPEAKAERKAVRRAKKQRKSAVQNVAGSSAGALRPSDTSAPRRKRGTVRGCAIQRSTEQTSARGGYADTHDAASAGDGSGSSDSSDSSEDGGGSAEDEDLYEE